MIVLQLDSEQLQQIIQKSLRKVIKEEGLQKEVNQGAIFLNAKQASEFLDLSIQTLYKLTSKRKIPFIKKGKKIYFELEKLESWLREGKKPSFDEIAKGHD